MAADDSYHRRAGEIREQYSIQTPSNKTIDIAGSFLFGSWNEYEPLYYGKMSVEGLMVMAAAANRETQAQIEDIKKFESAMQGACEALRKDELQKAVDAFFDAVDARVSSTVSRYRSTLSQLPDEDLAVLRANYFDLNGYSLEGPGPIDRRVKKALAAEFPQTVAQQLARRCQQIESDRGKEFVIRERVETDGEFGVRSRNIERGDK